MGKDELMLDVGQAEKLKLAFRRTGWNNREIDRLCEGNILAEVRSFLLGDAEIKPIEHVIDLDVNPFCPHGLTVYEHQQSGTFRWDPTKVDLYLAHFQSKGEYIRGHDLLRDLVGKPVFNACLLDYLLAHPHLIPEAWKNIVLFFWGTIYRDSCLLYVRFLCWSGGQWESGSNCLNDLWRDYCPAALRTK